MVRRLAWACSWMLAAALATSACGDDDDGGDLDGGGGSGASGASGSAGKDGGTAPSSCDDFTACGGDLIGRWRVTEVCVAGIEEGFAEITDAPGCEDFASFGSVTPRGEYTFAEDGTVSVVDASFTVALELTLTAECARGISGQTVTLSTAYCNAFAGSLSGSDTIAEATCRFAAGACACSATSNAMPLTGGGQFEVDGDELVQDGERSPYCVDGDRLSIAMSTSSMETGVLTFERR